MPTRVQLEDGTRLEFPDGMSQEEIKQAIDRNFPAPEPVSVVDETVGALTRGWNRGMDTLINTPYNVMRAGWNKALENTVGPDTLSGYRLPEAQPIVGQLNVTGEPQTAFGRITEAVGEVGGASALPAMGLLAKGASVAPAVAEGALGASRAPLPIFEQAARAPRLAAANEAAAAVGSGVGVGAAREAELGPLGELAAGLAGGMVAPTAVNVAKRTAAPMGAAVRYGNQAARRWRDPAQAGRDAVYDKMVKTGIDFDEIIAEYVPAPSAEMQQRGVTNLDIAEMIQRIKGGESATSVAPDYSMTPATAQNYVRRFDEQSNVPTNILDIAADLKGTGKARPLRRLGRAAYSISDDGDAAQALLSRQDDQSGRVVTAIGKAGRNRDFETEVARYEQIVEDQAGKAYRAARGSAQRFDLKPTLRRWRGEAFNKAGRIKDQLEQAIDLFYSPLMVEGGRGPMRVRKLGEPIADLRRFVDAREALDDMIKRSLSGGEPTPLTGVLSRFRRDINEVMRKSNPRYAEADDLYSGSKGAQALLRQGEKLTTQLGSKSREILKGFEKLTPEQQELVRLGFLRKLQDRAASVTEGHSVAQRFRSDAAKYIVRRLFKGDKELQKRGEDLIRDLRKEAITTQTAREVLSGSRTAELGEDMRRLQEGAQAAADLATGRWGQVLANLTTRLKDQIGEQASAEIMRILTETEPARMLEVLNKLARSAKTAAERQKYVTTIRELRAARNAYGVGVGTAAVAAD